MNVREAALLYVSRGWAVVACYTSSEDGVCSCGGPDCRSVGKHPHPEYSPNGANSATLDPNIVQRWPTEGINIGVALGTVSGNLMVFDVDDTPAANELLHPMMGLTDQTGVSVTGRGTHIWFRTRGSTRTFHVRASKDRRIGEVRGDGAYVVAPPSMHYSSRRYRWVGAPEGMIPTIETTNDSAEIGRAHV